MTDPEFETSWVYMMYCGGRIKIGTTVDLAHRLTHIQGSNPLPVSVIWAIGGGRLTEKALHKEFAAERIRGEWFDLSDQIRNFIDDMDAHTNGFFGFAGRLNLAEKGHRVYWPTAQAGNLHEPYPPPHARRA